MKIGYARVSSSGQHLDVQQTALTDAGCERIYEEKFRIDMTERIKRIMSIKSKNVRLWEECL